jgi:DNA polymerase III sliding clamp (beta) subunit (PCNA family)
LQAFSADQVVFYLKGSINPIIFEATGKDMQLLYLVMPVTATTGA